MALPGKILLTLGIMATTLAQATAQYKLVWADEFDGKEIDFTKWAVEENGHGGGNGELQYYVDRPENLRIEDGHLVMSSSVGNNVSWIDRAERVILEVNHWQSDQWHGLHDLYLASALPPNRKPLMITHPGDRIGAPTMP